MVQPGGGVRAGRRTRAFLLFLVLATLCVWPGRGLWGGARAQAVAIGAVATVVRAEGKCTRLPAKSEEWVEVRVGCLIYHGDRVRCGPDSWAVLGLADGGSVTLGPGCEVRFDSLLYLRLFIGRLWAKVKPAAPGTAGFSVETPSAVVGVRGTHFSVWVSDELTTTVSVASGVVRVFGAGKAVLVSQGYATRVKRGHAPAKPEPMDDDEKRAWAERRGRFNDGDEDNDENDGGDGGDKKAGKQGPDGVKPPGPHGHPGGEPPGDDDLGGDAEDGLASDGGDAGRCYDGGDA
ncbi:MAG: FecR family protein [Bacillota bacterium]|nr:FecR family protein [Bacillota bacterium]